MNCNFFVSPAKQGTYFPYPVRGRRNCLLKHPVVFFFLVPTQPLSCQSCLSMIPPHTTPAHTRTHTHIPTQRQKGMFHSWHLEFFSSYFEISQYMLIPTHTHAQTHAHTHTKAHTHTHTHTHTHYPDLDDITFLTLQNVGKVYYRLLHWDCSFGLLCSALIESVLTLRGSLLLPIGSILILGHTVSNLYF